MNSWYFGLDAETLRRKGAYQELHGNLRYKNKTGTLYSINPTGKKINATDYEDYRLNKAYCKTP